MQQIKIRDKEIAKLRKQLSNSKVIMDGIAKEGYIEGYADHDESLLFGVYGELKEHEGKKVKLVLQIDK